MRFTGGEFIKAEMVNIQFRPPARFPFGLRLGRRSMGLESLTRSATSRLRQQQQGSHLDQHYLLSPNRTPHDSDPLSSC